MHLQPRTWAALSLLFLVLALVFWRLAEREEERVRLARGTNATALTPATGGAATPAPVPAGGSTLSNASNASQGVSGPLRTNGAQLAATNPYPHRLSNTSRSLEELLPSDRALLLRNALIEVGPAGGVALPIPADLRASGDPGAYVVQAPGVITETFRAQLRAAGAAIVAYVPNNAYLVTAGPEAMRRLQAGGAAQAVVPWEPYFKLDPHLLARLVEHKPMPGSGPLNLLLFPGQEEAVRAALGPLGVHVTASQPTPFGPHLAVQAPGGTVAALAGLPGVQTVERHQPRIQANDLTRARLRVSTNTSTLNNYLGLTGAGVLVAVNDDGVEAGHPDLAGRVTGVSADLSGHGTHVAGIIASSGVNGPPGTNAIGSVSNANFRGMASQARIFSQDIGGFFGPPVTDTSLQEAAALTNALIANNSWAYFGVQDYSLASAIWDAAARDALPGVPGSQPLTIVCAAGNVDPATASLYGSFAAGISAPGTGKNVITVGASENYRKITNEVIVDGVSTPVWLPLTDTSNQVAGFSARGNVGVGLEGPSGRFKPDVVAPGTFIVSCRASTYTDPTQSTYPSFAYYPYEQIPAGGSNAYSVLVPPGAQTLLVEILTNRFSPAPFPRSTLGIYARDAASPPPGALIGYGVAATNAIPGDLILTVVNPNPFSVACDVRVTLIFTNASGDYFQVLQDLNSRLAPHYRYESGTSQSAAAVSGLLALLQEYYQTKLARTNSPALAKALLINGARTLGGVLDFQINGAANQQGWGLVSVTNSAPTVVAVEGVEGGSGGLVFIDQAPERALLTGESVTRTITVSGAATNFPLRITLAWTDPPGNPAVGPKLVNDLDLIVTNLANGQVYAGNDFNGLFTQPTATNGTAAAVDLVNNVENVYLSQRVSGPYSVTVRARRVNVNAVTAQTRGVAQDYALVISSGSPAATPIRVSAPGAPAYDGTPILTVVTNGVPLLHQRVGANSPLLTTTNGVTNQWHFFLVTNRLPVVSTGTNNTNTAGSGVASNIAFTVFLAPNLSWPRTNDADLDLYVSLDPAITNLDATALAGAYRSVGRGGTEAVVLANVNEGDLYYAAVKSEDQMAGEFGFFAVSSDEPFTSTNPEDGTLTARGYTVPAEIPDGSPDDPQAALVFAFITQPAVIQNVTVTNTLSHGNLGDLLGVLEHSQKYSVLNNHRGNPPGFEGLVEWVWDDSDSGENPAAQRTDTPGSLRNFVGDEAAGVWQLTLIDSSQFFTGRVEKLVLTIEPRSEDLTNGIGIVVNILPGRFFYTVVDVPADATNLNVCVSPDLGPVELYLRRGEFPTRTDYDTFGFFAPPGGCLDLGRRDSPPLSAGRYFIGVYNPNPTPVTVRIRADIQRDLNRGTSFAFRSPGSVALLDEARTNAAIFVPRNQQVAEVRVGVRLDHPRVSDLTLSLISPAGTRVVLAENRGLLNATNYGFGTLQTNSVPISPNGTAQAQTNLIGGPSTEGTLQVNYDFFSVPDRITVYYEGVLLYDSGVISGTNSFLVDYGPGQSTNVMIVMNEGGGRTGTQWRYDAQLYSGITYATFTDDPSVARSPIKFAPPAFNSTNVSAINVFTNAVGVREGFEAGIPFNYGLGETFQGWYVDAGDVNTVTNLGAVPPNFLAPDSGASFLDLNGDNPGAILTNFTTVPGLLYNVSFSYSRNRENTNQADSTARVSVYDTASPLLAELNVSAPWTPDTLGVWQHGLFSFRAQQPTTTLRLESTTRSIVAGDNGNRAGVFFDSVEVLQVNTNYLAGIFLQPEEPLTPFRGENAFGFWQLEVWDARLGAVTTNVLLNWRLNLSFINTNPPVTLLSNGVTHCATLAPNEAAFFIANVPLSASVASNLLVTPGVLDLLYQPNGVPVGTQPPDTFFLRNRPGGLVLLQTNGWAAYVTNALPGSPPFALNVSPVIPPGRRIYFAVRNNSTNDTPFCLTTTFDRTDARLPDVRPITSNCLGSVTSTNLLDYYQYDVGSNAVEVTFLLTNLSTALDLYAHRGLPLPDTGFYDAAGTNAGLVPEVITLVDFCRGSLPGRWYLGVANPGGPVGSNYTICASQRAADLRRVGAGGTFTRTLPAGGVHYYLMDVTNDSCLAVFSALPSGGNVDIYVRPDLLLPVNAIPTNGPLLSSTSGGDNVLESISVSRFSGVPALTPGCWLLQVFNPGGAEVSYTASLRQTNSCLEGYTLLTNCVPRTGTVAAPGGTDLYAFPVTPDVVQVVFEVYAMTGNVDLFLNNGEPQPPPGPGNFVQASRNPGLQNEFLCLVTNASPDRLTPGVWLLGVQSPSGQPNVTYTVRACALYASNFTRLASGIAQCGTLAPGRAEAPNSGVQFYTYTFTNLQARWILDTYGQSGNVDLYVQRVPPFTNFTTYLGAGPPGPPYASVQPGTAPEYLCLTPGSTPVPLGPGNWFVTVVNRDPTPVSYCLRATQQPFSQVRRLTNGVAVCQETVAPFDDTATNGVRYYSFNVAANAVGAYFEVTNLAGAGVDLFVQRDLCAADYRTFDPSTAAFPYASVNPGLAEEWVCVGTNATPVPLAPGDWYLAVVHRGTGPLPATYCVRATQILGSQVVRLAQGQEYCAPAGPPEGFDYYVFNASPAAVQVAFEAFPSPAVDLFVSRQICAPGSAVLAGTTNYPYASRQGSGPPEFVCLTGTSRPVPLQGGDWFVAVRRVTGDSYCVRATQLVSNDIRPLVQGQTACASVDAPSATAAGYSGLHVYRFPVVSNAAMATFELTSGGGNVDLYVQQGLCLTNFATLRSGVTNYPYLSTNQLANPDVSYYPYASTNLGGIPDRVCVVTNSVPVPLRDGDWYVVVAHRGGDTRPIPYCLRAVQVGGGEITELTSRFPEVSRVLEPTNGLVGVGVDYYHYRAAPNAIQLSVEVYGADGNVDLYARPGPCWMDLSEFTVVGPAPGTQPERLFLATNSVPVPLRGGDWYFAVANHESPLRPVTYNLRLIEYYDVDINPLSHCFTYTRSNMVITNFVSGTGIDYYVFDATPGTLELQVDLVPLTNDVNLLARRELPLPRADFYSLASTNTGSVPEQILLQSNTVPATAALQPGRWFFAVENATDPGGSLARETNTAYTLRLREVTTNDVGRLSNGVPATARVVTACNGVNYHVFRVSTGAVEVLFKVFNAQTNLEVYLGRGNPLPSAAQNLARLTLQPSGNGWAGRLPLTSDTSPALAPGDWYLAVHNPNPGPVSYTVCAAEFLIGPDPGLGIVRLTNTIAYANTLPLSSSSLPLSGRHHFVYRVGNGLQADFEVLSASGTVDLYLQRGLPLPGEDASLLSLTGVEPYGRLQLITNGTPALAPGDYYLTLVNRSSAPVSYSLRATEFAVGSPYPEANIVRLTNTVAYSNTVLSGAGPSRRDRQYYLFTVSSNALEMDFEVFGASGSLELDLRQAPPLPDELNLETGAVTDFAGWGRIVLVPNSAPVRLRPGDYLVSVVNLGSVPVNYFARFIEYGSGGGPGIVRLTNSIPYTNSLPLRGRQYFVYTAGDGLQADFEVLSASGAVSLYLQRGLPLPGEDASLLSLQGFSPYGRLQLISNGVPALAAGDYYLTLVNRSGSPVSYSIRATEYAVGAPFPEANIVRLTNTLAYSNTVLSGVGPSQRDRQYYLFTVSSNVVEADFEVFGASGSLELDLRQAPPLPDELNLETGTVTDFSGWGRIALTTNSSPVRLRPGDYLVSVINLGAIPVRYAARFTQYGLDGGGSGSSNITFLASGTCVTGTLSGPVQYYAFEVTNGAIRVQFDLHGLGGNLDLYARRGLPLPSPGNQDAASVQPGLADELIVLSTTPGQGIPLQPGTWFVAVVNPTPASAIPYTLCANQFDASAGGIQIARLTFRTNLVGGLPQRQACVAWENGRPGLQYHLRGRTHLGESNYWVGLSNGTFRAATAAGEWCVPVPAALAYFELEVGPGLPAARYVLSGLQSRCDAPGGFQTRWSGPTNQAYAVEWSTGLGAASWRTLTVVAPAPGGTYQFVDPDAACGSGTSRRFYLILPLDP